MYPKGFFQRGLLDLCGSFALTALVQRDVEAVHRGVG
jgi:hypothetical protein